MQILFVFQCKNIEYLINFFFFFSVGDDRVLLGTLRQDNRWDREISREDINDIWTRVTELKPSLKHSEVVSEWCGLRPDRKGGVRLEHKLLEDDKTNKQIHVFFKN